MNENVKYGAAGLAVVALSVGAVVYISQRGSKHPAPPPAKVAPAPAPPAEPEVQYPVATPPAPEPLPSLEQSDAPVLKALSGVIGKAPVDQFVVPEGVIRKFVVTIDNLPTTKVAERLRPVKPVDGRFATSGKEDAWTVDPANYERYKPMVDVLRSMNDDQLIALYQRYYPLFQDAYENLGHPPKYFNDRLIQVIDHLLAAPEVRDPVALAQPNVQFEYADPKLESRSAGQKVLMRMGSDNATAVKARLRSLRARLVLQKPAK
jgi:hypothetical protein